MTLGIASIARFATSMASCAVARMRAAVSRPFRIESLSECCSPFASWRIWISLALRLYCASMSSAWSSTCPMSVSYSIIARSKRPRSCSRSERASWSAPGARRFPVQAAGLMMPKRRSSSTVKSTGISRSVSPPASSTARSRKFTVN